MQELLEIAGVRGIARAKVAKIYQGHPWLQLLRLTHKQRTPGYLIIQSSNRPDPFAVYTSPRFKQCIEHVFTIEMSKPRSKINGPWKLPASHDIVV